MDPLTLNDVVCVGKYDILRQFKTVLISILSAYGISINFPGDCGGQENSNIGNYNSTAILYEKDFSSMHNDVATVCFKNYNQGKVSRNILLFSECNEHESASSSTRWNSINMRNYVNFNQN